jgi:hypothetical protein
MLTCCGTRLSGIAPLNCWTVSDEHGHEKLMRAQRLLSGDFVTIADGCAGGEQLLHACCPHNPGGGQERHPYDENRRL